ncbi:MAG: ABC transporter permease [Alistipes sp.]|nr:ABC transporter permease [Alistipes sp.]
MNLRYFIAGRYIRSRNSHSVINHISRVSIVAMAMPVAAIIVLLAIFNGLESRVKALYKAIDADITISAAEGTTFPIELLDRQALMGVEGVESLSLTLQQGAMVEAEGRRSIINLKGVDSAYSQTLDIADQILSGEWFTERDESDFMVASLSVMQELGMGQSSLGEKVSLYAINRSQFSSLLPIGGYTRMDAPVVGLFALNESNNSLVVTSLRAAQKLFNYPDRASTVELRLKDGADLRRVAANLKAVVGEEFKVLTRYESNSLYRLMALEKWGVFAVAALVMLIASLSIVGTLIMVIIDKRDDIATLRTLGLRTQAIARIFTGEGYLMTLAGLVIGLAIGLALTLVQQYMGIVRLNASSIGIDAYPVELQWADVVLTVVVYSLLAFAIVNLTVRATLKHQTK